ncbi:MAG: hypothetical protein RMK60_06640 [Burkholderiales bacterium]|nr:hypothetical protein [Burkholderiales bacterium]
MLEIGRLTLHLPPELEGRAPRLARLTGEALARRAWPARETIVDHVAIPRVAISPAWSDRRIAEHLAEAIQRQVAAQSLASGGDT